MDTDDGVKLLDITMVAADVRLFVVNIQRNGSLGDEPYYPVMTEASARLLAQYQSEAACIPGLVLGGRLGLYRYFDMDKAIANAMETVKAFLG